MNDRLTERRADGDRHDRRHGDRRHGTAPNFARAPELQYLAPEDYEIPPADPVLLAKANRMLGERLDRIAEALRGCGRPALAEVTGREDLLPAVADLVAAYRNATALVDKLQHLLDSTRHECEALRIATEAISIRDAEPDFETAPLRELLTHAALFLERGQSITIHPGEHCSIQAFEKDFVCSHADAAEMLTAAATLMRAEVPA